MGKRVHRPEIYKRIIELAQSPTPFPEIRKRLGLSPSLFTYYVKKMEKEGLVEVIRAYPKLLHATPKAKSKLAKGEFQTFVGGQSDAPHPTRLHATQVIIPVLQEGRPLPIEKEIDMRGWSRKILKEDLPADATVEIMDTKEGKKVRLYIHNVVLPPGADKFDFATKVLMKIIYVVNTYFLRSGWLLDIFHYQIVNQELETGMPELKKGGQEPKKVRVYLGRKAKAVDGSHMNQDAWVEVGTDSIKKGIPDRETNDRTHEEKWALLPEVVHDEIAPTLRTLAMDTAPVLKTLKEELEVHLSAVEGINLGVNTLNKLLHRLNLLLEEQNRALKELKRTKG